MRRLTPALRGRITRRTIVHSPATWYATAATFLIFGMTDFIVALTTSEMDPTRLYPLSAMIALIGTTIFLTRPPELGARGTHLVVAAVYCGVSGAVYAHAPQGGAPMITGVYIPVLAALWIPNRKHAAMHMVLSWVLLITAACSGGNDNGTIIAALCFVPTSLLLFISCFLVLDAVDDQADALDTLALRDPLTGVGNTRVFNEELSLELARHRSAAAGSLSIIDVSIDRFARINEQLGRAAGDAVLMTVARKLTAHAPSDATIARVDGDRFAVILPGADRAAANAFAQAATALMPRAGRHQIMLLAGAATYPADGTSATALNSTAQARRAAHGEAIARAPQPAVDDHEGERWTLALDDLTPIALPQVPRSVNRAALAGDRLIWRAIAGGFFSYALVGASAQRLIDGLATPRLLVVAAAAALLGTIYVAIRPPRIGTIANHAVVATGYLLPFAAMVATAPTLSWVVGTALFTPLLASVRLTSRRDCFAHLTVFTLLCLGLVVSGASDEPGLIAIAALVTNTWVLGACLTGVFEAAERQSEEIDGLVLRDPLTGAGNRDLLAQRLAAELPQHDELQLSLTLLRVDIADFDELVRHDGRGTGNQVLRDVAKRLTLLAGPHTTVARIGGSAFLILLPFTAASDLEVLEHDVRAAVAEATGATVDRHQQYGARVGIAEYPEEACTAEALQTLAAERCADDDPRRHDLRDALTVLTELHAADLAHEPDALPARRAHQ